MPLYRYQEHVRDLFLNGHSVILQAPTGAGKTRAALAPFIEAFFTLPDDAFPRQCIYSVPTRVLATQFEREYHRLADRYARTHREALRVTIQTGERPEDPRFLGDLVFATLDQTLSSALGVPYSLSLGQANLNVAAVVGSYLVFDEFHLFPYEATRTTLQLLRSLRGITPFILMTATFSQEMLAGLAERLDAKVVVPDPGEVATIETDHGRRPRKARRFHAVPEPLTGQAVLAHHEGRTLAVVNMVDRAIALYWEVRAAGARPVPFTDPQLAPIYEALRGPLDPEARRQRLDEAVTYLRERMAEHRGPWVMLLHSRFERPHRQVKEALLQTLWGPKALEKGREIPDLIVVATQVVEVGLDISARVLHTEIGPAAAVIQRAGRCARYPGEEGTVYVYAVPKKEDGTADFAPYDATKEDRRLCERSWEVFQETCSGPEGVVLPFKEEHRLVTQAHGPRDQALLQAMDEEAGRVWALMVDAMTTGETSTRPELIRPMDSRTLIVYEPPDGLTEESPYQWEGFSLWHGTLRGALSRLEALKEQVGVEWTLRYPIPLREEEESRIPITYRWQDVGQENDIGRSLVFAVHPRLVAYDAELGFRLGEESDGEYRSPRAARGTREREEYGYVLETYPEHIRRMVRVFEGVHVAGWRREGGELRRRLAWIARRLAEIPPDEPGHVPPDLLERAARLVMALHDVGKLDRRWQRWAAKYQQAIGRPIADILVVHTDYDPGNPEHREARQRVKGKPRSHAAEGAVASQNLLKQALAAEKQRGLDRAALMAIARHHSPWTCRAQPFRLHPQAVDAVAQALAEAGLNGQEAQALITTCEEEMDLILDELILREPPEDHWRWWLVYFILVRILRLCDGESQAGED